MFIIILSFEILILSALVMIFEEGLRAYHEKKSENTSD